MIVVVLLALFAFGLAMRGIRVFLAAFRHPERDYSVRRLYRNRAPDDLRRRGLQGRKGLGRR